MGVPDGERTGRAPRLRRSGARGSTGPGAPAGAGLKHAASTADMLWAMFWPLIGGFIVFVLLAIFMGWILDPARRGNIDKR